MNNLLSLLAASLILAPAASKAAVLITTGKDSTGRAFIEFAAPITFDITTTANIIDFAVIIKNAFPVAPSSGYQALGGGLYGSMPGNPSAKFDDWSYGANLNDVALLAVDGNTTTFNFVAGQQFTISSLNRFVTTNPVSASFPIFATGYYEVFLQNAYAPGQILSANAVPEPSSLALLTVGAAAALVFRRRFA